MQMDKEDCGYGTQTSTDFGENIVFVVLWSQLLDHTSGRANDNSIGRNILSNHTSSSNDSAVANLYAWQNHNVAS